MTDAAVAMGRVVAARYLIGRLLGSGTMGTVYAAVDLDLDREVAIKFASSEGLSHEETVERFRREAHILARLKSDHAVRVLDVGALEDGMPFMVMELLDGHGLDAERELRGVISSDEAVGYLLPAIEVLAEAHAAGAVHRDIKPANLFLERKVDGRAFVKILDFGVAKAALALGGRDTRITKSGMIMGSPLYMAPEQLRSAHAVDARADIWSLGAILFELVTGFTAHEGESVAELCATLLRDPPRSIGDFASELPSGFAEVVMRCLEPDPTHRYSNVAELGAALLPFCPEGAAHVERAKLLLAQRAPSVAPERAPSSDSPMTLHVGDTTKASTPISKRAPLPNEESASSGGFWAARMVMAFTLVGLGIGTAFLIEFPQRPRSGPAPALPAAAAVPPSPAPPATVSAPELSEPPGTPAAATGSSPLASASTPDPVVPAPSSEPPRGAVAPRKSYWKPKSKKKPASTSPK